MQHEEVYFEPRRVNDIFVALSRLPHSSEQEGAVRDYVINLVERFNTEYPACRIELVHYHAEPVNAGEANIILRRPGAAGKENLPAVVLQAHLDMVCVPVAEIFPLKLVKFRDQKGREVLKAGGQSDKDGTTLGADDGIGVATALAILTDPELKSGPLEVLLTVQEETSLAGAMQLDISRLKGDKFINLDSEDFDVITFGSAGGGNVRYTWQPETEYLPWDAATLEVQLSGLSGGHSGVNIHEGKGNAIKILTRALDYLTRARALVFRIVTFNTGNDKRNAIPSNAAFRITCDAALLMEFTEALQQILECMQQEYRITDPGLRFKILTPGRQSIKQALTRSATLDLIDILLRIPHGPLKMVAHLEQVVETSCNLAIVAIGPAGVRIECSNRSSVNRAMEELQELHQSIARLFGIRIILHLERRGFKELLGQGKLQKAGSSLVFHSLYPAWQPDRDSVLLKIARQVYGEVYGPGKFRSEVIHAGLECGWIIEKYARAGRRADCIAIGPTVLTPHTWNERLLVNTIPSFYTCVLKIIQHVQS